MKNFILSFLIIIIVLVNSNALPSQGDYYSSEYGIYSHSLSTPFVGDDMNNKYWEYGKDTLIDINRFIRLAPDEQSKTGWLWTKNKIKEESWTTEINININSNYNLIGDGMGFWLTEDLFSEGHAMGFKSKFKGIGIIIDTYDNGNNGFIHPRVSGFINNEEYEYKKEIDGNDKKINHCDIDIISKSFPIWMRVTYYSINNIKVEFTKDLEGNWEECFTLKSNFNINNTTEEDNNNKSIFYKNEGFYFGFTATTGGLSANYDILAINTYKNTLESHVENKPIISPDYYNIINEKEGEEENELFIGIIFIIIIIITFIACVYGIRRYYKTIKAKEMKRF